jgi:hypothetical protein
MHQPNNLTTGERNTRNGPAKSISTDNRALRPERISQHFQPSKAENEGLLPAILEKRPASKSITSNNYVIQTHTLGHFRPKQVLSSQPELG